MWYRSCTTDESLAPHSQAWLPTPEREQSRRIQSQSRRESIDGASEHPSSVPPQPTEKLNASPLHSTPDSHGLIGKVQRILPAHMCRYVRLVSWACILRTVTDELSLRSWVSSVSIKPCLRYSSIAGSLPSGTQYSSLRRCENSESWLCGVREFGYFGFADPGGEELVEVLFGDLFGHGLEVVDRDGVVQVPLDELAQGLEERLITDL